LDQNSSHSFDDIQWFDDEYIFISKNLYRINLNGIAKGYAVDKAVQVLENFGIPNGLVNAGGDLRLFGEAPAVDLHTQSNQSPTC
jgi:FAD:protein FMN transferase